MVDPSHRLEFAMAELPLDEHEFASVPPDGASADGLTPTPGLPLETARRADLVDDGLSEADRWVVAAPELELPPAPAMAQQHISADGLALIESFEGFSARRYLDPVGVPTIGYGTTAADIFPLPATCTRAQAEGWLRSKMASKYEPAVRAVGVSLNQHQFDALCSFVYNLGPGSLGRQWTIGRLLRAGQFRAAADSMLLYDHAGGRVLAGLTRRRQAERGLFLTPLPSTPDPRHPERFVNVTFTINGQRIHERASAAKWFELTAHTSPDKAQMAALLPHLVLLRKRIWTVSHFQTPPSWGLDWRGWRWQEFAHMTKV